MKHLVILGLVVSATSALAHAETNGFVLSPSFGVALQEHTDGPAAEVALQAEYSGFSTRVRFGRALLLSNPRYPQIEAYAQRTSVGGGYQVSLGEGFLAGLGAGYAWDRGQEVRTDEQYAPYCENGSCVFSTVHWIRPEPWSKSGPIAFAELGVRFTKTDLVARAEWGEIPEIGLDLRYRIAFGSTAASGTPPSPAPSGGKATFEKTVYILTSTTGGMVFGGLAGWSTGLVMGGLEGPDKGEIFPPSHLLGLWMAMAGGLGGAIIGGYSAVHSAPYRAMDNATISVAPAVVGRHPGVAVSGAF